MSLCVAQTEHNGTGRQRQLDFKEKERERKRKDFLFIVLKELGRAVTHPKTNVIDKIKDNV